MNKHIFTLLLAAMALSAAPVVDLSIQEAAGVQRQDEDVTMGVPLPENGAYTDPALFTLRDASNNILPCEITVIESWYKNPACIRWLQLNFPFTIAANATATVTLRFETAPYQLASKLSVQDRGAYFEVNTGKVRFYVNKANFNLLDQVWVDESGNENYSDVNKVVSSHARGLIAYVSNVEFSSSNDAASTVAVQRQGPGVVILKAQGVLKNSGGSPAFNFITRIYAYCN